MGFKKTPYEAPEERRGAGQAARGGKAQREEGGFEDGEHGRGSTPYKLSHSEKRNGFPTSDFAATSGRGGIGRIGKGDGFKAHAEDIAHPRSHAEFEALGTDDTLVGGDDGE
jgi:hypothetical protein